MKHHGMESSVVGDLATSYQMTVGADHNDCHEARATYKDFSDFSQLHVHAERSAPMEVDVLGSPHGDGIDVVVISTELWFNLFLTPQQAKTVYDQLGEALEKVNGV